MPWHQEPTKDVLTNCDKLRESKYPLMEISEWGNPPEQYSGIVR